MQLDFAMLARNSGLEGAADDHVTRTFEAVQYSSPSRPSDLNSQGKIPRDHEFVEHFGKSRYEPALVLDSELKAGEKAWDSAETAPAEMKWRTSSWM